MGDYEHVVYLAGSDLGLDGLAHIGCYRYSAAEERLPEHIHSCLEICYLARGRQTYRVEGGTYRLKGGDCYIVIPGEKHDTAEQPQEKGVLYWLGLDLSDMDSPIGLMQGPQVRCLRETLLGLSKRHFPVGRYAYSVLNELIHVLTRKSSMRELRASTLLVQFLLIVAGHDRTRSPGPSFLIGSVLEYVDDKLEEPLSVDDLARTAGLSPSRFKVRFRDEMGLPPGEYVLRKKIDRACGLLLATDATITDIAMDLGFSSSQYFATVFKRYLTVTPRSYRKGAHAINI